MRTDLGVIYDKRIAARNRAARRASALLLASILLLGLIAVTATLQRANIAERLAATFAPQEV